MHEVKTITDQLTLVVLDIRIWSGRKKLRPEDLKLGTEVPPADLVSLGSKRICNPKALTIFSRKKKAAERACLIKGTRFLGGFAIARDQAEGLANTLDTVKSEFDAEIARFLDGYDRALEDWILSLPQWEAPIRRAIEPASVVRTRLKFSFQLLRVGPAEHAGTLDEEVNRLGDGIFAEVEQMARELGDSFLGKEVLHRRALGTFRRIREKLACLSFVDLRIQPVVDTIDAWFGRVPPYGPIAGPLFNEGHGLALLLGDAEKMARHGAGQWAIQQGQVPAPREEQDVDGAAAALTPEAESAEPSVATPSPSARSFDEELDTLFGPAQGDTAVPDAPVGAMPSPVMHTDAGDAQPQAWTAPVAEKQRQEQAQEQEIEEEPALVVDTFFF